MSLFGFGNKKLEQLKSAFEFACIPRKDSLLYTHCKEIIDDPGYKALHGPHKDLCIFDFNSGQSSFAIGASSRGVVTQSCIVIAGKMQIGYNHVDIKINCTQKYPAEAPQVYFSPCGSNSFHMFPFELLPPPSGSQHWNFCAGTTLLQLLRAMGQYRGPLPYSAPAAAPATPPATPSPRFIKIDLKPQGGAAMTVEQEQLLKSFMLQSVHLDASLNEFSSHGSLTFIFKNPVATPVEMLFAFPLMDGGAVITGITTEWDGHRITGHVRETKQGKKEYSDAVAKGHTASLVEHAENDLFLWRVGGIPGGSTVTVVTKFCGPVVMTKRFGKKPKTEITLTVPAVVPPWYGKADVGDAALAFNTAVQAPASIGGLALAVPPFTATVRSRFITQSLRDVTVTSPTHGPPDASSLRTSHDGLELSFRDLFKAPAGGKAATNLQLRWVADGIVPNMACLGRMIAGAGQLAAASSGNDSAVSQDAAAVEAMEAAAAALAAGPLAADARALLDKAKSQQRQVEQVCGVLFSEHDGKQPEGIHVTVLVDCSGSMYHKRIEKARKAVRALLTSLHPSSSFAVYLFGSRCEPVVFREKQVVYDASPQNVKAMADQVDIDTLRDMGGTELFGGVQRVLSGPHVPVARRHNVMILTDGEVGQSESGRVKELLACVCPGQALVGIIGIGNEVTRTTLRTIVEGGLGPQAIMFDSESDESIANIVLGSVNALVSSQLRNINWPDGKWVGSQPHVQCNSSEVCAAWALYPEAQLVPQAAPQDEEWEVVNSEESASCGTAASSSGAAVRWLGGATVSVAAARESDSAVQLPTLLVTDEDSIKSMCVAAALARCRHASCPRQEATKLALRYGFVCAEADSVMVAISDAPVVDASITLSCFGIAIPSQPASPPDRLIGSHFSALSMSNAAHGYSLAAAQPHIAPPCFARSPMQSWSLQSADVLGSFGASAHMRRGHSSPPALLCAAPAGGAHPIFQAPVKSESSMRADRLEQEIAAMKKSGGFTPPPVKSESSMRADRLEQEIAAMKKKAAISDLVNSVLEFLLNEGSAEGSSILLSTLGLRLAHLKPADPSFKWKQLLAAHPHLFKMLDLDVPGRAAVCAITSQHDHAKCAAPAPPPMSGASPPPALAAASRTPAHAVGGSSLLDVLGALHGACWSMRHPAVAHFLAKQLPQSADMCKSDAHVTVAVIVVLRARFKDSKNGWVAHVKRAAQHARSALGDTEYASHKAALTSAMSK